ncbi:MAG: uncharacterized protein QOI61_2642 [Actinomycetota bacterium]|jgi:predicted nucleic acid-binding protein
MIAYFDTSAVVPLLIQEEGTAEADALWAAADRIFTARITYPEARAALGRARRLGRIGEAQLRGAVTKLEEHLRDVGFVEVDRRLANQAGDLAEAHALRGFDAVHLAAAEGLRGEHVIVAAGDGALLAAARSIGLMTAVVG